MSSKFTRGMAAGMFLTFVVFRLERVILGKTQYLQDVNASWDVYNDLTRAGIYAVIAMFLVGVEAVMAWGSRK